MTVPIESKSNSSQPYRVRILKVSAEPGVTFAGVLLLGLSLTSICFAQDPNQRQTQNPNQRQDSRQTQNPTQSQTPTQTVDQNPIQTQTPTQTQTVTITQPIIPGGGGGGGGGPLRPLPPPRDPLVSFGVLTGGQLQDWFHTVQTGSTTFDDKSGRYMIGPTLRFNMNYRYTLEFDALRRGFGAKSTGSILGVGFSSSTSGSSWEFPVLFRRNFRLERHTRSFLGAGLSIRHLSQDSALSASNSTSNTSSSESSNTFGIPIAAGLEFRSRSFRFTPELRYTFWTADKSFAPIRLPGIYDANPNQVAFLLGFTVN